MHNVCDLFEVGAGTRFGATLARSLTRCGALYRYPVLKWDVDKQQELGAAKISHGEMTRRREPVSERIA